MNYQIMPDNIDLSNSNTSISNSTDNLNNKESTAPTVQQQKPGQTQIKTQTFYQKFMGIFNNKTGTVLATAIGMAVGFSFKDLITSSVSDVITPLIIIILSYSPFLTKYFDLTSYISKSNTSLNIPAFISTIVSFILTIITVYYINLVITKEI